MSPAREEVFIQRSDYLPSRFTASAPDVALALAADIQESLGIDGAVSDSLAPLFAVSTVTHDAYGDQGDHVYGNNSNREFDVAATSLLVHQIPEGYVMPSASEANDSRSYGPASRASRVTASSSAPHQMSSDVTLDAIAKLLDDRISPLHASHNVLTSQLRVLQSGVQQSFKDYDTRLSLVEAQITSVQSSAIHS